MGTDLIPLPENDSIAIAVQAANEAGALHVFADHASRKADNTNRRKRADLALFETFLNSVSVPAAGLYDHPEAWRGVTWGIVKAFAVWQLKQGYAVTSINGRLSTVRTYAKLAARAGIIPAEAGILIDSVKGYDAKEARHIDNQRRAEGIATRTGAKKAQPITIPADIAETLKAQPDTPQGKRDGLLMCLLLEHGLRIGEIAILTRNAFDMKAGTLTFYRPKVNRVQMHELTAATRKAAAAYLKHSPAEGIIWLKSSKGTGKLSNPMSETSASRALTKRVELLGRKAGIEGLSAHDGRHHWATYEARNNTRVDRLMDAGGWNSPAMPMRYIEAAQFANEGTARLKGE
ncbi:MAG: tyrosine-type recombinase/integrase [Anaerolineales bacterium]